MAWAEARSSTEVIVASPSSNLRLRKNFLVHQRPVLALLDAAVDRQVGVGGLGFGERGHAKPDLVPGGKHVVSALQLVIKILRLLQDADPGYVGRDGEGDLMRPQDLGRVPRREGFAGRKPGLEVAQGRLLGSDLGLDDVEGLVFLRGVRQPEDRIEVGLEGRDAILGVLILQRISVAELMDGRFPQRFTASGLDLPAPMFKRRSR